MAVKSAQAAYEIILTEIEIGFLVRAMLPKYAPSVFRIIRAKELGNFRPAKAAHAEAYEELCAIMVFVDLAEQILKYHFEAEENRRQLPGAADDKKFLKAMEALSGMTEAPLIADVETEAAFTLWYRGGSWKGAMELAGLAPLTRDMRKQAAERYLIQHITAEMLSERTLAKLTPQCVEAINGVCEKARRENRKPTYGELKNTEPLLLECDCHLRQTYEELGLYTKPPASGAKKQKKKPKGPASGWKAANWYWLNSKKYKAMQRAGGKAAYKAQQEQKAAKKN